MNYWCLCQVFHVIDWQVEYSTSRGTAPARPHSAAESKVAVGCHYPPIWSSSPPGTWNRTGKKNIQFKWIATWARTRCNVLEYIKCEWIMDQHLDWKVSPIESSADDGLGHLPRLLPNETLAFPVSPVPTTLLSILFVKINLESSESSKWLVKWIN
jgi:hypothetical protein